MLKKITLLSFLTFISLTALPFTYYVAVKGSDRNSGTFKQPFATVQKAQELVKAGDTVYIRGGVYMMNESQIAKTQGIYSYVTDLRKSGSANARINYWGLPGRKTGVQLFKCKALYPHNRILCIGLIHPFKRV